MHIAAFISELQHYKNFKPSYLSTGKWAVSPFLSDQVTFVKCVMLLCILFCYSPDTNVVAGVLLFDETLQVQTGVRQSGVRHGIKISNQERYLNIRTWQKGLPLSWLIDSK